MVSADAKPGHAATSLAAAGAWTQSPLDSPQFIVTVTIGRVPFGNRRLGGWEPR